MLLARLGALQRCCRCAPACAAHWQQQRPWQGPQQTQQQQQQGQQQQWRFVFNEPVDTHEAAKAESFYDSTVEKYAQQPMEILNLEQMLHTGRNAWDDPHKVLNSARFVQSELPKRLARRLLDLQLLPFIVVNNPHIKRVYRAYYHAFETLRRLPPVTTLADNAEFCTLLKRLVDEHASMLDALARGLRECKRKALVGPQLALDPFLDAMLRSRISRRVMAEQHLHIHDRRPGYIGLISTHLDVGDAAEFAAQRTTQVCTETYGCAPEVRITGDTHAKMPYIPSHLDYMLYELLKNAMRAVVEYHRSGHPAFSPVPPALPPITVRICAGQGDLLTIKVSDQGGGIPLQQYAQVWDYGYTTIPDGTPGLDDASTATPAATGAFSPTHPTLEPTAGTAEAGGTAGIAEGLPEGLGTSQQDEQQQQQQQQRPQQPAASASGSIAGGGVGFGALLSSMAEAPKQRYQMAGLGFGLPLSRLYARYFGGDLSLQNMPGYGVDAYLRLRRLDSTQWREQVDDFGASAGQAQQQQQQLQQQQQQQDLQQSSPLTKAHFPSAPAPL